MTTSARAQRGGYTAIELMLVLSIVSILSAMSAPSVVSAMRKAAITEAADVVAQVSSEARILAMRNQLKDDYYGVVVGVDQTGRGYVALTYGDSAQPSTIMQTPDGRPILRLDLKRTIALTKDDQLMKPGEFVGWMHQYTTGATVAVSSQSAPAISVGNAGSPICTSLGVQSHDLKYRASIMVFPVGLSSFDAEIP